MRFGPSFTTLTSVETFDDTAAPAAFEPTMNFGGFVNIALGGAMSFQPEVIFAAKGEQDSRQGRAARHHARRQLELPDADRVILVRYLEFPLLLRMSKRTHENTSLYLMAGPAIALRRNAVIREVVDAGRHEVITMMVKAAMTFRYIAGRRLATQALAGRRALDARDAKHRVESRRRRQTP